MDVPLKQSELIVNDDGSIYHLMLRPEHVAPTVLLVGDQGRVGRISAHFDKIDHVIQRREFLTHTGTCRGIPLTVLSTGIGTDNIDIVVNELDALVNIDLKTRMLKKERRSLNLIRIGTSGGLQEDIPVGSFVASEYGLGFDGLIYYYDYEPNADELALNTAVNKQLEWPSELAKPYTARGSTALVERIGGDMIKGITATATGFYGPQGRRLFLTPKHAALKDKLTAFSYEGRRITNFEMETSALYALGNLMGHKCLTCCGVIANRIRDEYSDDAQAVVDGLIQTVLERLITG